MNTKYLGMNEVATIEKRRTEILKRLDQIDNTVLSMRCASVKTSEFIDYHNERVSLRMELKRIDEII